MKKRTNKRQQLHPRTRVGTGATGRRKASGRNVGQTSIWSMRIYLVGALVLLLSGGMATRLVYLQINDRVFLQNKGDKLTVRTEEINAHRGIIQDRRGKPLAVSTPALSLWAHPGEVLSSHVNLAPLAALLGDDLEELKARLYRKRHKTFLYLHRHMPPAHARRILALDTPGIYAEREYHRFYPAGEVASHIVGFTNIDDKGLEGLEKTFDQMLAGVPGSKKVLKNNRGEIFRDLMPVAEAVPGRTLTLAIDLRVQYLAYRELKAAVTQHRAESGSVVVLDVATGQVLAMANLPSYNPNNRNNLDYNAVRNRALTDMYEPGSTVKPFTVAVALESGKYQPGSTIDTDPGYLLVGQHTITDPSNRGVMSLRQIITHSSQVGISKLALSLNEHEVWKMFQKMGFGHITSIGFQGESAGYLPGHRRWSDIDRVTFAYGYGLTVTPLQLASAYLVIASGGLKKQVSLIARAETESTRVLSPRVAGQLKEMLAQVVRQGTGVKAQIKGYKVAGKSGTVRKMGDSGYQDTRHLAFFAGLAPLDKPRLVGVVVINGPGLRQGGGGAVAAPVFSRVMFNALRILNVAPARTGAVS